MEGNQLATQAAIRVHIACRSEALRAIIKFTAANRGWAIASTGERAVVITDNDGERSGGNVVVVVDPNKPAHAVRVLRRISAGNIGGALCADRLVEDLPQVVGAASAEVVAFSGVLSVYAHRCPTPTDRQERVLNMIAFGLPYTTIARRLHVSLATIKREVSSLFELFGCATQAQLVAMASKAGFLQP